MKKLINHPVQKILFGPPGSGKSLRARKIASKLAVSTDCIVSTTFHPSYDYGDFVVKLLPMTVMRKRHFHVCEKEGDQKFEIISPLADSVVEYNIYVGHLIRAVAKAITVGPEKSVLLIIDEINRGDCSRIFGDMFQLLDRDLEGWSEYGINISDITFSGLMKELGWTSHESMEGQMWMNGEKIIRRGEQPPNILYKNNDKIASLFSKNPVLHFPPNLSIVGTMNTSDESVYFMDTAFKRRWEFEFVGWNYGSNSDPAIEAQRNLWLDGTNYKWLEFLTKLNKFIANTGGYKRVDDKQIGLWFLRAKPSNHYYKKILKLSFISSPKVSDWEKLGFLKPPSHPDGHIVNWLDGLDVYMESILKNKYSGEYDQLVRVIEADGEKNPTPRLVAQKLTQCVKWHDSIIVEDIRNKLMHFLWENVFSRDRSSLDKLIFGDGNERLRTFEEFISKDSEFVKAVMSS